VRLRSVNTDKFSGNVLASVAGGALLLAVTGGAVTVAVTNDSDSTATSAAAVDNPSKNDHRPSSTTPSLSTTTTAAASDPDSVYASSSASTTSPAYPVRYDPSENGSELISARNFYYFFDRTLYVEVEAISKQGDQFVLSKLTVQEGILPRCTFQNVHRGRFFYRRSGHEYELTLDLDNTFFVGVNVAEWTGRTTFTTPCAGEGLVS
jgi:hypothetical protein